MNPKFQQKFDTQTLLPQMLPSQPKTYLRLILTVNKINYNPQYEFWLKMQ